MPLVHSSVAGSDIKRVVLQKDQKPILVKHQSNTAIIKIKASDSPFRFARERQSVSLAPRSALRQLYYPLSNGGESDSFADTALQHKLMSTGYWLARRGRRCAIEINCIICQHHFSTRHKAWKSALTQCQTDLTSSTESTDSLTCCRCAKSRNAKSKGSQVKHTLSF